MVLRIILCSVPSTEYSGPPPLTLDAVWTVDARYRQNLPCHGTAHQRPEAQS